ncbi:hypothetical protein M2265_001348 [Sphingobacterium kitahiroshimense]|nr:hypothetical protein [Sphingobacterium kitahiroshimense]
MSGGIMIYKEWGADFHSCVKFFFLVDVFLIFDGSS